MPRGDRTGPDGMGPRTGRGMGFCSGYDSPGYSKCGFGGGGYGGRGFGRGLGFGRGYGWRARAPYDPYPRYNDVDDLQVLKEESRRLDEDLKSINSRIKEIEKS